MGNTLAYNNMQNITKFAAKISTNYSNRVMLDIYENTLYETEMELKQNHKNAPIVTIIASVRDKQRMEEVFEKYRPQVVFHAAAHKHVPLMEISPVEAIKNNVFGTYYCYSYCLLYIYC